MARALLAVTSAIEPRLGSLSLRPHQRTAVGRLLEILASHRGALLADAVGLGKTYVALTIAREHAKPVVICPAALRNMWDRALRAARVKAEVFSTESLSRGALPVTAADLLIVDEAHHFRTPGTRRYEAIAHLARRARVLLLSATPLHNSRRDVTALLALFAGSTVAQWSDAAIARLVVRRDETSTAETLPGIDGPHVLSPGADDDCLDAIVNLPPTIPAADEGVAHALNTMALLHLWSSSRAALVASVRKRLARATALHDAVAAGHVPTMAELSAWRFADDALQLALPFFSTTAETSVDKDALAAQLERFVAGARALLDLCRDSPDPDADRVSLLRSLRESHGGARIVAFSQYATTIAAFGRRMRADPGVAVVTAGGASIASGALERDEVLAQFAGGAPEARPAERIGLLLTTDLLSEGIDLRGASVVVHLDLPWNPARLDQRVGRSRRMGSSFETIHVYTFVPPTAAERILELERRLQSKVATAHAIIGGALDPFGVAVQRGVSSVSAGELLRRRVQMWIDADGGDPDAGVAVAAAEAPHDGWLAVVIVQGVARMIVGCEERTSDDPGASTAAIEVMGSARAVESGRLESAERQIREWLAARDASAGAGQDAPAKRAVLDRLSHTIARSPRHRRSATVGIAQRARTALRGLSGVGSESVLASLARSTADDEAWLQSIEAFGAVHANDGSEPAQRRDAIVAVIILERISPEASATPG